MTESENKILKDWSEETKRNTNGGAGGLGGGGWETNQKNPKNQKERNCKAGLYAHVLCLYLWKSFVTCSAWFPSPSLCSLMFFQMHLDHHSSLCYYLKTNQNLQSLALKPLSISAKLLPHFGTLHDTTLPSKKAQTNHKKPKPKNA